MRFNINDNTLHFCMMCNSDNGGFDSALTLLAGLRSSKPLLKLKIWSLWGTPNQKLLDRLERLHIQIEIAQPTASVNEGDALFFYHNEYPQLMGNFTKEWRVQFERSSSVQMAFNRTVGGLPLAEWMAERVVMLYFQDRKMQNDWYALTRDRALHSLPSCILAPPVRIDSFLDLPIERNPPLVIGRLAGDANVNDATLDLYERLNQELSNTEFWFMPASNAMRERFSKSPNFKLYDPNEIDVVDFFEACGIYLLDYVNRIPIPGPRSLVEAMAAGCAPVVINREGPKERVVHKESGFLATTNEDFYHYVVRLANNEELRLQIARQARERATQFAPDNWLTKITSLIEAPHD